MKNKESIDSFIISSDNESSIIVSSSEYSIQENESFWNSVIEEFKPKNNKNNQIENEDNVLVNYCKSHIKNPISIHK
jgi:hypothetical protein